VNRGEPPTEAELLEAYHRTDFHRRGIEFMAALNNSALRSSLELGALMARHPRKHHPIDHKALTARNDD
jgi:hypothetical protein